MNLNEFIITALILLAVVVLWRCGGERILAACSRLVKKRRREGHALVERCERCGSLEITIKNQEFSGIRHPNRSGYNEFRVTYQCRDCGTINDKIVQTPLV